MTLPSMPPKKGKKKSKVTLSLADFNPDAAVGTPVELASLPSAPKQADEWEAVGGRPEYNSRGFKERTVTHDYDDNALVEADEAFAQRDWVRGANMRPDGDGGDAAAGAGGVDRSWDTMRRAGPLDGDEDGEERDFGMMRRGPVDSQFGDGGGAERDFGAARGGAGPIEAQFGSGGAVERDFTAARGGSGPVDAEFNGNGGERDFGAARGGPGPVEAEFRGEGKAVDFARRTGPVDADFSDGAKDIDFAKRSGPIEAEFGSGSTKEIDFGGVRAGAAFEADFAKEESDVDFSGVRKGNIVEAGGAGRGGRDVDFSVRSGPVESTAAGGSTKYRAGDGGRNFGAVRSCDDAREEAVGGSRDPDWSARKGPIEAIAPRSKVVREQCVVDGVVGLTRARQEPVETRTDVQGSSSGVAQEGHAAVSGKGIFSKPGVERDWGRARDTKPLPPRGRGGAKVGVRAGRGGSGAYVENGIPRTSLGEDTPQKGRHVDSGSVNDSARGDGDWTTVQAPPRARGRGDFRNSRTGSGHGLSREKPQMKGGDPRPAVPVPTAGTAESAAAATIE